MNYFSKVVLVAIARKALYEYFMNSTYMRLQPGDIEKFPEELQQKKAVFVSLKKWPSFDFRASNGNLKPEKSILETVIDKTIGAARHDSIFPILKRNEIANLLIQINILGNFQQVTLPCDLQRGKALLVKVGKHTGFFLPELTCLAKWDFEETISQLCLKSGLPGNTWRHKRCKILTFDCESFVEKEPGACEVISITKAYH